MLLYFYFKLPVSLDVKLLLKSSLLLSFSHSVLSGLRPHGPQHARSPCPSHTPELAQTHVHGVVDAVQPACPLLSPSPPAFNLSQHQFSSVAQSCLTLCDPMNCNTPGLPVYHQLPQFTQTHVHWVRNATQPSHPLLSPSPPALNLSSIRVFSKESALHIRWPMYWSFSFSISPSNEHPGLISFGMDWLDLLAVQGTLKSLLQHHSSKASILQRSALFIVQLSHPYMTTGKNIALTRWTFVGKVMSLLFNMLSRLVITLLPRSKHLLIHGCSQHL